MSGLQENYSFDAPSTYIDFGSFHEEDDQNADSWFDQMKDENTPPSDFVSATQAQADENAVSDSGNVKQQKTPATHAKRRSSKHLSAQQRSKQLAKIRAERKKVTPKQEEHPPYKRQRLNAIKCKSTDPTVNKGLSTSVSETSPKPKSKPTRPSTPTVLKRKNMTLKVKNSEEQELEKVQQLQQELSERLKKNEESLKSALAGSGQVLKKVPIQVTKPVDIHFHTDDRIKRHQEETSGEQYKQVDFTSELRKHPPSPARIPKGGRTIPKPFNLSQGNKRKHEETTGEYVSTAEQIIAFCKKTPQRYHMRSRQKDMEGPSPVKTVKLKLTHPKTPLLQTKQRHRPTNCKSSAELETEELDKIQQYKFKAQELNTKILEGSHILPKKPPVKESTKPIGFNLEIEKRLLQREKKDCEEELYTFRSKPCPSKILTDIVGVPGKIALPLTMPQSPAFALKNRVRIQTWEEMKEEPMPIIKANPMPHYGVPFKPKVVEHRQVEVCPFSFTERDQQQMEVKEKKLDQLRNPEVPKFKAQPLPDFDHIALPEKKVKEATLQAPFDLQMDKRGEHKLQRWKQQIKEEQKQQKEMTVFKARPNTVTQQEPFIPKKDSRILTESLSGSIVQDSFELATEKRAKERQEFERLLAEKEAQKSLMEEEQRRQQEEQEREEINRLRHELVHKAQPVRKFKQVDVKTSDIPLTVPKSPKFSDRFNI